MYQSTVFVGGKCLEGHLAALTGCVISHFSASAECFFAGRLEKVRSMEPIVGWLAGPASA